jgi:ActR/RegA family two-component response regulator
MTGEIAKTQKPIRSDRTPRFCSSTMTDPFCAVSRAPWKRAASLWRLPKVWLKVSPRPVPEHPKYAVVDMRLQDGNGLDVIEAIRERRDDTRIIVLTGYGNIATAVTAVKLGAIDYLAKPADADEVYAALTRKPGERAEVPENPMSADRVRWEHIQRVYEMCERNVSETARRLNMHRRTLQRILAKRAPR